MFQFLIGRLKTAVNGYVKDIAYKFQFLIGRLKTRWEYKKKERRKDVSIPDR